MRFAGAVVAIAWSCLSVGAQAPASTPISEPADASPMRTAKPAAALPPEIKDSAIGFSYSMPSGWESLPLQLATSEIPYPTVVGPKKGNACAQPELAARQGSPYSVVVVVTLPFDCYGQTLTKENFTDFASGAAEGLKQTFDVTNPVISDYMLGNHSFWIERANGTVKGQPESRYTLEITCTLMQKGAVCWWTMAGDAAHLQVFENGPVTVEGDAFDALVPAGAVKSPVSN